MWKEPNIDIYACNISSVNIYKYNKLKYTNLSIQNWTRFTSCSPKRPFKQLFSPFKPFRLDRLGRFFLFFDRLNGQPFNFRLPPKQNSLPPFTVYWPFKWPFNPFRRTLCVVCWVKTKNPFQGTLWPSIFEFHQNTWNYALIDFEV